MKTNKHEHSWDLVSSVYLYNEDVRDLLICRRCGSTKEVSRISKGVGETGMTPEEAEKYMESFNQEALNN